MDLLRVLSLTTAAGAVLTGGALFAFSAFVMPALDRLPSGQAVAAMQAINVEAPRSLLMVPLVGSAVGAAAVGLVALLRPDQPGRGWLLAGAVAGVAAFALTAAYHVPRNDALALVDPGTTDAARQWAEYAGGWVRLNHVRTLLATASGVALVLGSR